MEINFISSKDSNETCNIHTKRDYLLQKYEEGLEKSMKGSEFVFDSVDLLYYRLHKMILNRGGSYIDFSE